MKTPLLLLSALCMAICASASQVVTVHLTNGTSTQFHLSENMKVTFPDEGKIMFSDGVNPAMELQQEEVLYVAYGNSGGVPGGVPAGQGASVRMEPGQIIIGGCLAPEGVYLLDAGGRTICHRPPAESVSIPLHGLPPGVYLLTGGSLRLKIRI